MKNFTRLFAFLFVIQIVIMSCQVVSAQKLKADQVPVDVSQTLEFQYPYVKVTGWQLEGSTYIASFKDEGSLGKVYISDDGKWIRTTYAVPKDELPSVITEYVKENYPDFGIYNSCLEEAENVKMHYYLEVKLDGIGTSPSILTFSTDKGELLSREDPPGFVTPEPSNQVEASFAKAEKAKTEAKAEKKNNYYEEDEEESDKKSDEDKSEEKKQAKTPKVKEQVSTYVEDESISASRVPESVRKTFTKKVMKPEELKWYNRDTVYVAKCLNAGNKTSVYIKPNGMWEKTLVSMPEESVTGPMLKHLNTYYKGFKFKSSLKELRSDKQDRTLVEFYEKANYKKKIETTIIFDKAGKLIRTIGTDAAIDLDENVEDTDDDLERYYKRMNMAVKEDGAAEVPQPVLAAFKLKYPRVNSPKWEQTDDMDYMAIYYTARGKEIAVYNSYGELLSTMVQGKVDNMNVNIQTYLKKNYKAYKPVDIYSVKKIAEKQNLFKVIVAHKKTKAQEEVWFNTSGKPVTL